MRARVRSLATGALSLVLLAGPAALATAQSQTEPVQRVQTTVLVQPAEEPPVTNCYPLQGLVLSPCTVPINVGPFGPFNFDFLPGGSVFPPAPPPPTSAQTV